MSKYQFSHVEAALMLAVCSLGDNASAGSVSKKIRESGEYISLGGTYVILCRLEANGYLKTWMSEPEKKRGGRGKRMYKVSSDGLKALTRRYEAVMERWQGFLDLSGVEQR